MNSDSNINEILDQFNVISLIETVNLKLLDRIESKYVLNINLLSNILKEVMPHYSIVENNSIKKARYLNVYYDTPSFQLYFLHHNGKGHRYKFRKRCYLDDNKCFLEIKEKTNTGRTLKKRIQLQNNQPSEQELYDLKKYLPKENQLLAPVINIEYNRITLVSKTNPERITIDLNINATHNEKSYSFKKLVIIEVKQKEPINTRFTEILKAHHLRKESFSKYCYSVCNLLEGIKSNNFKELNLKIKKIMH